MYVVTTEEQLKGRCSGILNRLSDGRVYIPINELRNVGTLMNVDIYTGHELTKLKIQMEKGKSYESK